jgi:predicted AlkP superfamily phosphohydrolase/phosphomutase
MKPGEGSVTGKNQGSEPRRAPIVVIGWDAATWDLLDDWVQAGQLPNLARLMQAGSYGPLQSTPLPLSPAAWSTVITGLNPGRHAVFDWFERRPDSYAVEYVHSGRLAARPLWEYFNAGGWRVGVLNLPMIYPARPLDGFMVSGMAAPNPQAAGFTYPSELLTALEKELGPYILSEAEVYKYGREEAYLHALQAWLEYQRRTIRFLVEGQPCDLYLLVFMQSDHVQHKFWRYLDAGFPGYDLARDRRYRDGILGVYRQLDEILGELLAYFGPRTTWVLLSDHGAGPAHGVMYLNRWLHAEGYLYLRQGPGTHLKAWLARTDLALRLYRLAARLGMSKVAQWVPKPARNRVLNAFLSFDDIDWSRTRAYARGAFGQIFINLRGREPAGTVEPGEAYDDLVAEIVAKLGRLKHPHSGEPLITDIYRRDQVMHGPFLARAADIQFSIQHYLYQSSVKLGVDSTSLLDDSEYEDSGSHRPQGILVLAGEGVRRGGALPGADVADVLPTLLGLADLPIPPGLDGRPLIEALSPELAGRLRFEPPDRPADGQAASPAQLLDLDPAERTQLEERLRNLGYLG